MANAGSVNVDLQMTGSAIRLRALQLAIGTLNHDFNTGPTASKDAILGRAASFEQYIERGKPEAEATLDDVEKAAIREAKHTGPSAFALSIEMRLQGVSIGTTDAEFLISAIRSRTRN